MSKFAFLSDGSPERIVKAAVRQGRTMTTGRGHFEAYEKLEGDRPTQPARDWDLDSGFVTSHGRYVDRDEAMKIVKKSNQLFSPANKVKKKRLDSAEFDDK